jgi:alpha-beta hydrolase superfamily lysophospholipase
MRIVFVALLLALCAAEAFASPHPTLPRRATLGAVLATAEGGVSISAVSPNSAAARAGLAVGDVVTRIGDQTVTTPQNFRASVAASPTGRAIALAITRGGAAQTLSVTLDPAPMENDPQIETIYGAVSVDNSLRRTLLTVPRNARGRHPAMLIVGGIGCYSVDNAEPRDPYRRLAYDLGRRGIVVMRLEKGGIGDSQGGPCATIDLHAESRSYEAATVALRANAHVDPARVFLFGHSIGTIEAPDIAARQPVAGVIAAQGFGRTWVEYEMINTRRQLELAGNTPADVDATLRLKAACMNRALIQSEPMEHILAETPDCQDVVLLPASQAYMHQLTEINVAQVWTAFNAPALVIYGTSDFITDEPDHRRLVDLVNGVHPGNAQLALLPGMDHFLAHAATQAASMQRERNGNAFGEYYADFSTTIGDWICARARCAA